MLTEVTNKYKMFNQIRSKFGYGNFITVTMVIGGINAYGDTLYWLFHTDSIQAVPGQEQSLRTSWVPPSMQAYLFYSIFKSFFYQEV